MSKIWQGRATLPAFLGGGGDLILRGALEGAWPGQISAIEKIVAEADKLRTSAAPLLLDLCRQTPLSSVNVDIEPGLIWTHFQPYFIECDASYYGDERFAILIAFEAHVEPAFVSVIQTADGRFIGVLSGT